MSNPVMRGIRRVRTLELLGAVAIGLASGYYIFNEPLREIAMRAQMEQQARQQQAAAPGGAPPGAAAPPQPPPQQAGSPTTTPPMR